MLISFWRYEHGIQREFKAVTIRKKYEAGRFVPHGRHTDLSHVRIYKQQEKSYHRQCHIADVLNISLDNLAGRKWNTCRDHKKPGAYTGEYTGEYTDELRETLHKLTEKEYIFVMDVIKALKQHLQ